MVRLKIDPLTTLLTGGGKEKFRVLRANYLN